jgi:ADP-ribose pyrophosphatase
MSLAKETAERKHVMDLTEKTLGSEEIYRGKIICVRKDTVLLPNGKQALREVVEHPGGVGILALDERNCVPMVTQYRYCFQSTLLEIPAGKLEKGEDPFEAAMRELKEEVGATAETWLPLGELIASPGCYNEVLHLYLARKLTFGDTHFDEDEFLNVERIPFDELTHRVMDGEIRDAKTAAAVLKAKVLLNL